MGWCHEFGPEINPGCDHPMVADANSCGCVHCGTVCKGRFNSCASVWKAGPVRVTHLRHSPSLVIAAPETPEPVPAEQGAVAVEAVPDPEVRAELESMVRQLSE